MLNECRQHCRMLKLVVRSAELSLVSCSWCSCCTADTAWLSSPHWEIYYYTIHPNHVTILWLTKMNWSNINGFKTSWDLSRKPFGLSKQPRSSCMKGKPQISYLFRCSPQRKLTSSMLSKCANLNLSVSRQRFSAFRRLLCLRLVATCRLQQQWMSSNI